MPIAITKAKPGGNLLTFSAKRRKLLIQKKLGVLLWHMRQIGWRDFTVLSISLRSVRKLYIFQACVANFLLYTLENYNNKFFSLSLSLSGKFWCSSWGTRMKYLYKCISHWQLSSPLTSCISFIIYHSLHCCLWVRLQKTADKSRSCLDLTTAALR